MNKDNLEYYRDALSAILPLASVYPLRFKVWSDTGASKTLDLNAESLKALTEIFNSIENLKEDV